MNTTKKKPLNENAKKWVAALRSGKYKQAKNILAKIKGPHVSHCCLGVACELYIAEGHPLKVEVDKHRDGYGPCKVYGGYADTPPTEVIKWLGLREDNGAFKFRVMGEESLAELNDAGKRFTTIANVIESQPEGLFTS